MQGKGTRIRIWMLTLAVVLSLAYCGSARGDAPVLSAGERRALKKDIEVLEKQARPFTELFSKTIRLVMPSVVSISTTKKVRVRERLLRPDNFFGPFGSPFRERPRSEPRRPREREFKRSGLGSGFVIDARRGYVVTNYHVVEGVEAENIKLTFYDGRAITAEKVFRDQKTEVAVIKIPTDGLVALEWGDSKNLDVGQWVIAIGSPMGFGNTATSGIISATGTKGRVFGGGRRGSLRVIRNLYAIEDYIQTDTAINPGNSGGPLVTLTGKVIGINTLIVSSSGASAGLGFAVPERLAKPVVEALIEHGRVVRGHLGVSITEPGLVDDDIAWELFEMRTADEVLNTYRIRKDDKGVVVARVLEGGPADEAGIEKGDVITALDGTPVEDMDALRETVAAAEPGTNMKVTLMRKGRTKSVTVTLGEQPGDATMWVLGKGRSQTIEDLGLKVQTLTPEVAAALGYPEGLKGAVITEVRPESPAARGGLQPNDVVVGVGRKSVGSAEEFKEAAGRVGDRGIALRIKRGDDTIFVPLKP